MVGANLGQLGRRQLWLIGGTRESQELSLALAAAKIHHVVTVVTPEAATHYPTSPWRSVCVGAIAPDSLSDFLKVHNIAVVLDASHPFAVEISHTAIAACEHHQLPYLRYERPEISPALADATATDLIQTVVSYNEILTKAVLGGERVLITVGARNLYRFQPWQHHATLFARILPTPEALKAALAAGFTPARLIALRPPISRELELALWQQWQISQVITKASGQPGGEIVKRSLAQQLGIRLWILARPKMGYPRQTEDLQTAIAFCQDQLTQIQSK